MTLDTGRLEQQTHQAREEIAFPLVLGKICFTAKIGIGVMTFWRRC
jgi:hypothetical protein